MTQQGFFKLTQENIVKLISLGAFISDALRASRTDRASTMSWIGIGKSPVSFKATSDLMLGYGRIHSASVMAINLANLYASLAALSSA